MSENYKLFNRILVVDDEPTSSYLSKIVLEDMKVAEEVIVKNLAVDGLDFIKATCMNEHAAKEECPDLILLDINMPVMDGFEFIEELHKLGQTDIIRSVIVVLSSSNNPRDKQRVQSYGVKAFITKPITEEKVLSLAEKRG